MIQDDLAIDLKEFIKILDENVEMLEDLEQEVKNDVEDEIEPDMNLVELIDMGDDLAESSKLRNAEENLMQRQDLY